VAAYLLDKGEIAIVTDAGERRCRVEQRGEAFEVTAEMGAARIVETFQHPPSGGRHFLRVDVGNPHAVSFDPHDDAELDRVGPELERSTDGGINVELCRMDGERIVVAVWERGVGRTQACGTGACAALAAAAEQGLAPYDRPVITALPGGDLSITLSSDGGALTMRGPARFVFRGETRLHHSV
jgi:diaminopimelate epimerase